MALSNVFINTTDGNIGSVGLRSIEKVSGLLFDISKQPKLFSAGYGLANIKKLKEGDIAYITNRKQAIHELGIIPRVEAESEEEATVNFLYGIPYYHIHEYFRAQGDIDGESPLYIMFADCSKNWDAIELMQRASGGTISQLGIWTEQPLWKGDNESDDKYRINVVGEVNEKAVALGKKHMPLSIMVHASTANLGAETKESKQIDISKIPNAVSKLDKVTPLIGQARNEDVSAMQLANKLATPVGFLGAAVGLLSIASVSESIAWVQKFNLFSDGFQRIEMGFGDTNLTEDTQQLTSTNFYESLSESVLDELDDKGYVFPVKYAGVENGVYVSKDKTLSNEDFRTIARNRTIHKSRRLVRTALLPSLNSPIAVDPKNGQMSAAKVTAFKNTVSDALLSMQKAQEISGFKVEIDPAQNILKNDSVKIGYKIVPVGTSASIYVEESLSTTNA